jgi:sugar phosphate isomerase/epimerase
MPDVNTPAAVARPAHTPVLISLSSFGAAEVRRHGQGWFSQLCADAGADGVEVRGELLVSADTELDAIGQTLARTGLAGVYSSHQGLWAPDGSLDTQALNAGLSRAHRLGTRRLKMSIGGYTAASAHTFEALHQRVQAADIDLVIENDQTTGAGSLAALMRFFDATDHVWPPTQPLGMTFDIGNWHWQGECPLQAASALAARVTYVHCKGVQRQPHRWVAVPIAESAAPWRAVVSALPTAVPWAIEYPLVGDDLTTVTRTHIEQLRAIALHQGEAA